MLGPKLIHVKQSHIMTHLILFLTWLIPHCYWDLDSSFTKKLNPRLAKRPLKSNGRLANRGLTFLVKVVTGVPFTNMD